MTTRQRLKWWKKKLKKRELRLARWRRELEDVKRTIKTATGRINQINAAKRLVSDAGVDFVAHFEGFPNGGKPYNDPVGHCTIGYGHLIHRGNCTQEDYRKWGQLTEKEAKALLREDLAKFARGVRDVTTIWPKLAQHERDALVSFAFNVGLGAYGSSTLLKKLNQGDKLGASKEFPRWVYADGKELPGLVRRREAERKMFLGI